MTNQEIGKLIRQRRLDLSVSMEKEAEECGVSKSTICRWESGYIEKIKRSHIYMLSRCLYIPVDILLGDSIEPIKIEDAKIISLRIKIKNSIDSISNKELLEEINDYISFVNKEKKGS
jgi:transcriptional regulator with XRE-family HTH domain